MIIILWTRTTTSTAKNYVSYVFLVIPSTTSSTRATLYWGQRATLSTGQIYGFTEQRKANLGCGFGEIYLALIHSSCCYAVVLLKTDNKHERATLDYLLEIVFQESHKLISRSFSGSREVSVPFPWLVVGSRKDRDCNQWWWSRERYILGY